MVGVSKHDIFINFHKTPIYCQWLWYRDTDADDDHPLFTFKPQPNDGSGNDEDYAVVI